MVQFDTVLIQEHFTVLSPNSPLAFLPIKTWSLNLSQSIFSRGDNENEFIFINSFALLENNIFKQAEEDKQSQTVK